MLKEMKSSQDLSLSCSMEEEAHESNNIAVLIFFTIKNIALSWALSFVTSCLFFGTFTLGYSKISISSVILS